MASIPLVFEAARHDLGQEEVGEEVVEAVWHKLLPGTAQLGQEATTTVTSMSLFRHMPPAPRAHVLGASWHALGVFHVPLGLRRQYTCSLSALWLAVSLA